MIDYIYKLTFNNKHYYFTSEYKALHNLEKFGKIIKKSKDKITIQEYNGFITKATLIKLEIDKDL